MDPVVLLKPLVSPCKRSSNVWFTGHHVQALVKNGGVFTPLRNIARCLNSKNAWIVAHVGQGGKRRRTHAAIHAICGVRYDPVDMSEPGSLERAPRRQHATNHSTHLNTDPVRIGIAVVPRLGGHQTRTQVLDGDPLCGPAERYLPQPFLANVPRCKTASMSLKRVKERQLVDNVVIHRLGLCDIGTDVAIDL